MVHVLQAKPFGCHLLSLQSYPSPVTLGDSIYSLQTEENQNQILFSSSCTLSNILAFTEVKFHTSLLNENRIPLWIPGAEKVTVIVMNLCNRSMHGVWDIKVDLQKQWYFSHDLKGRPGFP